MGRMINIGYGNVVNADKILAVVKPEAAPIKRMVAVAKDHDTYVDATCGRKCKSVIVSVEGRIVLSALLPETIGAIKSSFLPIFPPSESAAFILSICAFKRTVSSSTQTRSANTVISVASTASGDQGTFKTLYQPRESGRVCYVRGLYCGEGMCPV